MSITPVSGNSNATVSPLSHNNVIKMLERQKIVGSNY